MITELINSIAEIHLEDGSTLTEQAYPLSLSEDLLKSALLKVTVVKPEVKVKLQVVLF